MLSLSSSNFCQQDFIPTSLLTSCSLVFSELIPYLANLSLSQAVFPSSFKIAQVTPLLKKAGLDKDDPANYRPISNLNIISKLLEMLLLVSIQNHVTSSPNFNPNQSAYRPYHSTETALVLTLDNILHSADQGSFSVLVSLDLNAAFDTIDHNILLSRLKKSFGIHGLALSWFQSYSSGRSQFVRIGHCKSPTSICIYGVPQGSVLGPLLFSLYISPIIHIASSFGLIQQQYADDTQLYIAISCSSFLTSIHQLEEGLSALHVWFSLNGLALNPNKSHAVLLGTWQRQQNLPSFAVGGCRRLCRSNLQSGQDSWSNSRYSSNV